MGKKGPTCAIYNGWTESKFWAFLRSGLRRTFTNFPVKWQVLNEAKVPYKGQSKQQKWMYKCAACKAFHKGTDVSVDHIVPAGQLNSYDDLVPFVQRLFVAKEGLQVLCKACHNKKSAEERSTRGNTSS